jgi:hypothetical protein
VQEKWAYFMPELVVRPQKIKVFGRPGGGDNKRVISTITILWGFIYALGQFALFSQLEKAIFFYALGYYYRKDKSKKIKAINFSCRADSSLWSRYNNSIPGCIIIC